MGKFKNLLDIRLDRNKKQWLQFGLLGFFVFAGIITLLFLIPLLVSVVTQRTEPRDPAPQVVSQPPAATFLSPEAVAREIFLPDIIIPNEVEQFWENPWRPYREPRSQWMLDDVRQFWSDPVLIGTETLSQQNREKVREFLKTID